MHPSSTRSSYGPRNAILVGWIATLVLIGSACGDETADLGDPVGTGGEGGGVAPDPLDLDSCDALVDRLPDPTALPVANWGATDEQAVMCALRVLDAAIANRAILCLGENSHGVAQSSRWHALLARYLVHQLGVRTIAMEVTRASTAAWNSYLRSGDPADLAYGFEDAQASLGNSVESEELIKALARVEAELPEDEQLTVTGFDVAVQPQLTRASLLALIEVVAPTEHAMWSAALPELAAGVDWAAAGDAAADLLLQLEQNETEYLAMTDEQRYADALIDAANLRDGYYFLDYYLDGNFSTGNATFREPGMIRNIERLRASLPSDQPLLLIAHDLHCARGYTIGNDVNGNPSPAFGTHLDISYGAQYAVMAQLYMGGSYLANSPTGFEVTPFSAGAQLLESAIGAASASDALLVGTLPTDDGVSLLPFNETWLMWNQPPFVPVEQYDMLLWLREVGASTIRP